MTKKFGVLLLAATALSALPAAAQVAVDGTSLNITLGVGNFDVGIITGPFPGEVRLTGVPGVLDGSTYSGIETINYSALTGTDNIQIRQSGEKLPAIAIGKSGPVHVDVLSDVASASAPIVSSISVTAGAGSSSIKNIINAATDDLTLNWRTVFGAGSSTVEQEVLSSLPSASLGGAIFVDLGTGSSVNHTVVKTGAQVVDLDVRMDAGTTGELTFETIHERPGAASTASVDLSGAQKIQWNWAGNQTTLGLVGVMRGSANGETFEAEIDANTTGTLSSLLANGDDTSTITLKGVSNVTGAINGAGGNDSLKLQIDGFQSGVMRLNGGLGIDFCSAPSPALRFGCEQS